jgi:PPIC-type PPIASE domain
VISTNTNINISDRDLIYEAKLAGKLPNLVRGIIRRKVIESQIKKAGIDPNAAELQQAADRFRTVNHLESAEATNNWLQEHHLSVDDFEDMVTQDLLATKLARHLFAHQVEQFFHQNFLDYSAATFYEIILEDRDLAMELYYSLQEGDLSFADVAHQYISDPEFSRRGGYVGTVGRKQLRPEISAAIFAATPPQLIKPIITAVGVHLIQVAEIIEPKLDERLHQQILIELFERWLSEKTIEISPQISFDL